MSLLRLLLIGLSLLLGSLAPASAETVLSKYLSKVQASELVAGADAFGPISADLAAAHKLLGNALFIGTWAVLADVLTLARACNVDAHDAIDVLKGIDLNAVVAGRGASMARGDFTPNFELTMARKDENLMLETVAALPLAALPAVAARIDQLIAAGHGDRDVSVLAVDAVR